MYNCCNCIWGNCCKKSPRKFRVETELKIWIGKNGVINTYFRLANLVVAPAKVFSSVVVHAGVVLGIVPGVLILG